MNIRRLLACLNVGVFSPELERPLQAAAQQSETTVPAVVKILHAVLYALAAYGAAILYKNDVDHGIKLICFLSAVGTVGFLFPQRHFSHAFYMTLAFALPAFETASAVCEAFGCGFAADSVLPEATTALQALTLLAVLWRDMDLKEKIVAVLLFCSLFALFCFPGTGAANTAVVFLMSFFTDAKAAGIAAAILLGLSFFAALTGAFLPLDAAAYTAFAIGAAAKLTAKKIGERS